MTQTSRERAERMRTLRQMVAEHRAARDAEAQRRIDLPASACRVCGAPVHAGEGTRESEHERAPGVAFVQRWTGNPLVPGWEAAPAGADDWRRAHDTCARLGVADVLALVTGLDVSEREAANVNAVPPVAAWRNLTSGEPFGFVADDEREALRAAVRRAVAETRPSRCRDGACALCGARESVGWLRSGLRWADGREAPVCGACRPTFERFGSPRDREQLAAVVVAASTGFVLPLGRSAPAHVVPYAMTREASRDGLAQAWAFGGIAELQADVWRLYPQLAPEAERETYERLHAEAAAAQAAAAAAEAERERLASW